MASTSASDENDVNVRREAQGASDIDGEDVSDVKSYSTRSKASRIVRCEPTCVSSSGRRLLPDDLDTVQRHLDDTKNRLGGCDVDESLSLRVVRFALKLKKEHLEAKSCNHEAALPNETVSPPRIREKVVEAFSISMKIFERIMKTYAQNQEAYKSGANGTGRTGNTRAKKSRIQCTNTVRTRVQTFLCENQKREAPVAGTDVLRFLLQERILTTGEKFDCFETYKRTLAYRTDLTATNRWLKRNGFRIGETNGTAATASQEIDGEPQLEGHIRGAKRRK